MIRIAFVLAALLPFAGLTEPIGVTANGDARFKRAADVSRRISEQFLSTDPTAYKTQGYRGGKAYGGGEIIHYATVSLWVNALECARFASDTNLESRLVEAFARCRSRPSVMNEMRHVDLSIVGAVPLEVAILTGSAEDAKLGLRYADRQWSEPKDGYDWGDRWYDPIALSERHAWWEKGYTPETRLWIDDMYMITVLQSQAYRLTGDEKYIERAGREMCLYLERLQREDGLFNHSPSAPYAWGRGNGWMAAGMALNLKYLPEKSEWRGRILDGYRKMMTALVANQRKTGLWGQLVDDAASWDETSGSAMFAFAIAEGLSHGWLNGIAERAKLESSVDRAFDALCGKLDEYGNLAGVCVGTGWKNDHGYYLSRGRCNGDPHGQAPLLWLCGALMRP